MQVDKYLFNHQEAHFLFVTSSNPYHLPIYGIISGSISLKPKQPIAPLLLTIHNTQPPISHYLSSYTIYIIQPFKHFPRNHIGGLAYETKTKGGKYCITNVYPPHFHDVLTQQARATYPSNHIHSSNHPPITSDTATTTTNISTAL